MEVKIWLKESDHLTENVGIGEYLCFAVTFYLAINLIESIWVQKSADNTVNAFSYNKKNESEI